MKKILIMTMATIATTVATAHHKPHPNMGKLRP